MIAEVVDTNVLQVANDRDTHAPLGCVHTCTVALRALQEGKRIVIDDDWRILREYLHNALESGQPGVGDAFLKWVLQNQANPERCERVRITPRGAGADDFDEFPDDPELATFDPSDRKFVAVALASDHGPAILNATDTDWSIARDALGRHGLTITFLCPELLSMTR